MELEEKVLQGFDRLSSIAGNISPIEISQWFNKMLMKKILLNKKE